MNVKFEVRGLKMLCSRIYNASHQCWVREWRFFEEVVSDGLVQLWGVNLCASRMFGVCTRCLFLPAGSIYITTSFPDWCQIWCKFRPG